jgi:steroid delta-isomerase-like uncharacterized protein
VSELFEQSASALEPPELEALASTWAAAWTGSDGARFDSCCTHDVSYEDPIAIEPLDGLEALSRHAQLLRGAFPDARVEPTSPPLAAGSHACFPWRLTGTHSGETAMLPATDRSATVHGVHYVELADGRIRRARGFFDLYDAATQLGLLPGRGSLGEAGLLLLRGFGFRRSS